MKHVVFVVPFAFETSLRFLRGAVELPDVRVAVVSQEPPERLPTDLLERLAGHERVADALDPDVLERAVKTLQRPLGGRAERVLGVLEQLQGPVARVRERLGVPGMDAAEAERFRDKGSMKDALRRAGLPCADHGLAYSAREALALAERCGYPLVVKPPAGAGAKATSRVESRTELEGYLRTSPPAADAPLLMEEFVTGREHSLDSITLGGRHLFHSISRYYPTPLEVMERPWIQWCVVLPRSIEEPEFADVLDVGPRALDALGMVTGMSHLEWFRRPDGRLAISEVAARPPGAQFTSLISWAHGLDFYRAWARLMILEEFEAPARSYAVGAIFLRGQGEGSVRGVTGFEEARGELGSMVVEASLPRPGQSSASSYEGEGFVVLRHAETEAVEEGLRQLIQKVRVDIGPKRARPRRKP